MITINYDNAPTYTLTPTIFPDGTSQVWKLPQELIEVPNVQVRWSFESEREIIDILSLFKLLKYPEYAQLYIPYLPYARQDKAISNDLTFNLEVFADIINTVTYASILAVDVHNHEIAKKLINRLYCQNASREQETMIVDWKPDYIVYPDLGARNRYGTHCPLPNLIFNKIRSQYTGEIIEYKVMYSRIGEMVQEGALNLVKDGEKFLIFDDICDGGQTFINVAKEIRNYSPNANIHLHVTHGIFSKGIDHLLNNGIDSITATDSLPNPVARFHV